MEKNNKKISVYLLNTDISVILCALFLRQGSIAIQTTQAFAVQRDA